VFNPHDHDVEVQLLVRDPQAKDFNSRYNGSATVKPGRSTIDLDYTRLPRYATQDNEKPDYVDARQITLFVFFLEQPADGKPITLFFDNVRLAREATDTEVCVRARKTAISFNKNKLATSVEIAGHRRSFPEMSAAIQAPE